MSEVKDPAIKLFGKSIPLLPRVAAAAADHEDQLPDRITIPSTTSSFSPPQDKSCNSAGDGEDDGKKLSKGALAEEDTKSKEQHETSNSSQENTLKKPDKILPCPRCKSMETKFCYFNNYNVNQPRHFCKKCQRYWTAGGTMRNVPVGSGRRKNKSSSSLHYRHIMLANGLQYPSLRPNGTVLVFEKSKDSVSNGFHGAEQKISGSSLGRENAYDCLRMPSTTISDSKDRGGDYGWEESVVKNFNPLPTHIPCFGGPPGPCPWNSTSGFPTLVFPTPPFWGCALPGSWNELWPSPCGPVICSGPSSLTLGKHSREGEMIQARNSEGQQPPKENKSERGVWVPKTLRIDDPIEAAKSSIWSSLGIKNEKIDPITRGGLFKPLNSNAEDKKCRLEPSLVLQANPAALSRSLNFHESAL